MSNLRQNPLVAIRTTSELRSGDFNERKVEYVETPLGIGEVIDRLSHGWVHVRFSLHNHDWFEEDEVIPVEEKSVEERKKGRFKMKVPRPNVPPMVPNTEHPPVPLDTSQFNAYEGAGNKPYTLVVKTGQALRQHIKKAVENLGGTVLYGGYSDGSTTWSWLVQIPMTASKLQKALWGTPGLGSSFIAVREPSQEEFEESKIEKMIDEVLETGQPVDAGSRILDPYRSEALWADYGTEAVWMGEEGLEILLKDELKNDDYLDVQKQLERLGYDPEIDFVWHIAYGDDYPSAITIINKKMQDDSQVVNVLHPWIGAYEDETGDEY